MSPEQLAIVKAYTLGPDGESRIGIEHRLEPQQSVTETVGDCEEIRVRTL